MTKATVHPDRRLISSEDVQGTNVYGIGDDVIGEIDHLLSRESVRPRLLRGDELRRLPRARTQSLSDPMVGPKIRHTWAAIEPVSPRATSGMLPNSATIPMKIATGRRARTSITGPRPIGKGEEKQHSVAPSRASLRRSPARRGSGFFHLCELRGAS